MNHEPNYFGRRVSRRQALRGAGLGVAGLTAAALIGCGDDEDSPGTGGTAATGGGTATGGGMATVTSTGTPVAADARTRGGTLTFAYHQDPAFLSPRLSRSGYDNAFLMVSGDSYVYIKADGNVDLERSLFEQTEFAEDTQLRATLRSNIQFHDGSPFNSEAVKAHLEYLMDENRADKFGYASLLSTIDTIDTPDDQTVVFNLSQVDAGFMSGLAVAPGIPFSVAAVEANGDDEILNPVMTGPYKVQSYTSGAGWSYVRNDDFWGPESGTPFLDQIDFVGIPQAETRGAALEAGDVDVTWFVSSDSTTARLSGLSDLQGRSFESGPSLFTINQAMAPLDDIRVRQALAHSIDKEKILESEFQGQGGIAYSMLPTNTFGWVEHNPYPFDPAKARQLMDAVGADVTLKYAFGGSPPSATTQLVASLYQEMFAPAGIKLELENVPGSGAIFDALFENRTHHVGPFTTGVRPDPVAQYALYATDEAFYNAGRDSTDPEQAELTRMVAEARATLDDEERRAMVEEIGRKQLDNVFSQIPIVARIRWSFAGSNVVGFDDPEYLNTPAGASFRARLLSLA